MNDKVLITWNDGTTVEGELRAMGGLPGDPNALFVGRVAYSYRDGQVLMGRGGRKGGKRIVGRYTFT